MVKRSLGAILLWFATQTGAAAATVVPNTEAISAPFCMNTGRNLRIDCFWRTPKNTLGRLWEGGLGPSGTGVESVPVHSAVNCVSQNGQDFDCVARARKIYINQLSSAGGWKASVIPDNSVRRFRSSNYTGLPSCVGMTGSTLCFVRGRDQLLYKNELVASAWTGWTQFTPYASFAAMTIAGDPSCIAAESSLGQRSYICTFAGHATRVTAGTSPTTVVFSANEDAQRYGGYAYWGPWTFASTQADLAKKPACGANTARGIAACWNSAAAVDTVNLIGTSFFQSSGVAAGSGVAVDEVGSCVAHDWTEGYLSCFGRGPQGQLVWTSLGIQQPGQPVAWKPWAQAPGQIQLAGAPSCVQRSPSKILCYYRTIKNEIAVTVFQGGVFDRPDR